MRKLLAGMTLMCWCFSAMGEEPGKVTNKEAQCEVTFPEKPEFKETAMGAVYTLLPTTGSTTYRLQYTPYVAAALNDELIPISTILDTAQEALIKTYGGTLVKKGEDTPTAQMCMSRMFEFEAKNYGYVRVKLILANKKYYYLEVYGNIWNTESKEAQAFFDSFKLTNKSPEKVVSLAGQCEILFPKKPELKKYQTGEQYVYVNEEEKTEFMLRWDGGQKMNYSEAEIKEVFDNLRVSVPASLQAQLLGSKAEKYGNTDHPKLTLRITKDSKGYIWTIILARGSIYQVVVTDDMDHPDTGKTKEAQTNAFLDSFKLLGKEQVTNDALPVKVIIPASQCEIIFPMKPEVTKQQNGEQYLLVKTDEKREYMLCWDGGRPLHPTKDEISAEFQKIQTLLPEKLKAKLFLATEGTLINTQYPKLSLQLTQGETRYQWHCILARGCLYQLVVKDNTPPELGLPKNPEAQDFFHSFKLLGKVPTKISTLASKCEIIFPHKPIVKMDKDSESYQLMLGDNAFLLDCNRTHSGIKTDEEFCKFLDPFQKKVMDNIGGKVTKATNGIFGEHHYPLRTLDVELQDSKGVTFYYRWRFIFRDGCLYQVVVGGSKEVVEGKEAEEFFKSFKILETA